MSPIDYINLEGIIGFPTGAYQYGCLLTVNTTSVTTQNNSYRNMQIYIPHDGNNLAREIYVRTPADGFSKTTSIPTWRRIEGLNIVNATTA